MEQVPPQGSRMGDGRVSLETLRPPPADFSGQDCPGHPTPPTPLLERHETAELQLPNACRKPAALALLFVAGQLLAGMWGFAGLWKKWLQHPSPWGFLADPGPASSPNRTQATGGLTEAQDAG